MEYNCHDPCSEAQSCWFTETSDLCYMGPGYGTDDPSGCFDYGSGDFVWYVYNGSNNCVYP